MAGQRTEHGNLWVGRTGARGRRWDQSWGAGEEKIEGPSAGPSRCHGTELQASGCGCRPLPPEPEAGLPGLPDRVGHAVGFGLLRAALSARCRWCQTTGQG